MATSFKIAPAVDGAQLHRLTDHLKEAAARTGEVTVGTTPDRNGEYDVRMASDDFFTYWIVKEIVEHNAFKQTTQAKVG